MMRDTLSLIFFSYFRSQKETPLSACLEAYKKFLAFLRTVIFMVCAGYILLPFSASAEAASPDLSCLDGLEQKLDGVSSTKSIQFCDDYHPGWIFRIHPYTGYRGVLTNGSALRLFSFRQPNWRRGEPNTLDIELSRYNNSVFSVHIRDGDKLYKENGKRTYFLWGADTFEAGGLTGPYGGKWDPARFIRCLTLAGYGCVTYYDVIVCPKYRYPSSPQDEADPIMSISTDTPVTSEDLLANFEQAHVLVEEALQRLLIHTCK
ncbi:hypothetical protein [Pseudovibrio sp. Ad37]|uniref:hypothetical protein n=1 Tax=Pseudovibrio sp. Ad37 TaxID=989422 RepID=UPI0007AE6CFC|nr:hypothetical protein [Pseudovibrio sp. Ad37]KZL24794.1 hypothetical protein PsAD37_02453 [Pseudovibrio sp. Ad37]